MAGLWKWRRKALSQRAFSWPLRPASGLENAAIFLGSYALFAGSSIHNCKYTLED